MGQWRAWRAMAGALIGALALALFAAPQALAQTLPTTNSAEAAPEPAEDPFGRSTPAGAMAGYIQAIAEQDYERAARYLDLSGVAASRRAARGPGLAEDFQRVLDREGTIRPRTELSRDPAGTLVDGLEADLERVGTIGSGEQAVDLLLRRIENADGTRYWAIARQTLDAALARDDAATAAPVERWLPESLSETRIGGVPLSHWLSLALLALAAIVASWLILRLLVLAARLFRGKAPAATSLVAAAAPPLVVILAVFAASWTAPPLGIAIVARQAFDWFTLIAGWLAFGWLLWRVIDAVSARMLEGFTRRGRANATAIVRVAGRIAKLVALALTIIAIFDIFGFDVTAAIAALGIGGIALALGAQKTVENLIASLSIISDRPFKVGDTCRFGTRVGTVEDVGMRSSRVRTLDRTLLTIPNSSLVNAEIENLSDRDTYWFHPTLHIAAATPPEMVRGLLTDLRALFAGDARLVDHKARVRVLLPVEDRLPIEIFGYVAASDFDAFLEIQEELTLKLLDTVGAAGLSLAPPSFEIGTGKPG